MRDFDSRAVADMVMAKDRDRMLGTEAKVLEMDHATAAQMRELVTQPEMETVLGRMVLERSLAGMETAKDLGRMRDTVMVVLEIQLWADTA